MERLNAHKKKIVITLVLIALVGGAIAAWLAGRSRSTARPCCPMPKPPPNRFTLLRAPRAKAEARPVAAPSRVTTRSASP